MERGFLRQCDGVCLVANLHAVTFQLDIEFFIFACFRLSY